MKKFTPLGSSDFKAIIEENRYYVDKTLLAKHIIEGFSITLLCRPRRFGKTLNLDMLKCFFTNESDNRHLFGGMNIERDAGSMAHLGKYPVIFFSLKEIKFKEKEVAFRFLRSILSELWQQHHYVLKHSEYGPLFEAGQKLLNDAQTPLDTIASSLKTLTELVGGYHGTKVILLIDEYDTPVHASWLNGYYDEMVAFLKLMLGRAMKDNRHLQKGVLTGILRVSKESMFSDLNNFIASTVLDSDLFSDLFGFTEEEVLEMFRHYELNGREMQDIHDWYDGYRFGRYRIYNPWSILRYVQSLEHQPEAYWVNTSDDKLLQSLFLGKEASIKEYLEPLIRGEKIKVQLDKNLVFQDLRANQQAVWTMLVLAGYLSVENPQINEWFDVFIPNYEVQRAFTKTIQRWLQNDVLAGTRTRMLESLVLGEVRLFERYLSEFVLRVFSYHDTAQGYAENFYHAFLLGLFADWEHRYRVLSNREAGYGRYDICLIPHDKQEKGIVFEIKAPEADEQTIENALKSAARQIKQKKYAAELAAAGVQSVILVAIAVQGKAVKVREVGGTGMN